MQSDQWTVNQPEVQVGNIFVLPKMRLMSWFLTFTFYMKTVAENQQAQIEKQKETKTEKQDWKTFQSQRLQ